MKRCICVHKPGFLMPGPPARTNTNKGTSNCFNELHPLVAHRWESHLQNYPDRELVQFFLEGFTQGFKIGFNSGSITLESATRNLPGALLHPKVVEKQGGVTLVVSVLPSATAVKVEVKSQAYKSQQVKGQVVLVKVEKVNSQRARQIPQSILT